MKSETTELLHQEGTLKNLAKYLALHCVRNSPLENLHAGTSPDTVSGDYSDVRVVSPSGEIPWTEISRLSDAEMKELMISVVDQTWAMLRRIFLEPRGDELIALLSREDLVDCWLDPPSPGFEVYQRKVDRMRDEMRRGGEQLPIA